MLVRITHLATLSETVHDIDGRVQFEATPLSTNELLLYNIHQDVSYTLIGYQLNTFDYDKLFYENIEYFLQEYTAWKKSSVVGGSPNVFDAEHFLQFTPENNTTFYSSHDALNIPLSAVRWDFEGGYTIYDVEGYEDIKLLTLAYDVGDIETFELRILDDSTIELYHITSKTTYTFAGKDFKLFLKETNTQKLQHPSRKRTRIQRETRKRAFFK